MAKSKQQSKSTAQTVRVWWAIPAVALGCAACAALPILHVVYGSSKPPLAVVTGVVNLLIFITTYLISRRVQPKEDHGSLRSLLLGALASLPVFIIAFIGLGYEISIMADFGAMYILGIWIGTSEAAAAHCEEN